MKIRTMVVGASLAAAAVVAGAVVALPTALAAVTPPYEPDAYSLGSITLYDASGNVVTGGSTTSHPLAAFAVADGTTPDTGTSKFAWLQMATPDGTPNTYNYGTEQLGGDPTYPVSGAGVPSVVSGAGATTPVVTGGASDLTVDTFQGDFPNTQSGSYANLYQLRLYTPSTAAATPSAKYFSIDIQVDNTAHTWQVVYPAPVAAKTATSWTAITPNPTSPAAHGASVSLSATLSAADGTHPDGTVTWRDGTSTLTGGTFDASTGSASIAVSPADGSHSYTVAFAPTNATTYSGSTSAALSYTVNGAPSSDATTTTISSPAADTVVDGGSSIALTAHVTDSVNAATIPTGSVTFSEGGTTLGSATVNPATGDATATLAPSTLARGDHSITASFTPSGSFLASSTTAATMVHVYTSGVQNELPPATSGVRVGSSATCAPGTWFNAATYSYSWYLDASASAFATSTATTLIPAAWAGHKLRCTVTAWATTGSSAVASSTQTAVALGAAVRATRVPTISGTPKVGKRLTGHVGSWTATPVAPTSTGYRYAWKVGSQVVSRSSSWTPGKAFRGRYVLLYVYAVRGGFLTGVAHSAALRIG